MTSPEMKRAPSLKAVLHAAVVLAALVPCAAPCRAGVSYDVSVGLPIGDDAKVFLNVTNEYYAPPQEVATVLVQRCPNPEDDYPTVLFLAHASGRPPAQILDMRLRGMAWSDIMFGLRLSPSILFVGFDRDPGPPYGRAWGYWRQHPRGRLVIADREFVEFTKLQVAAGYYHVRPWDVVAERKRGVTIEHFAAERHRARAEKRQEHRERAARHEEREDGEKEHGPKAHGHPHGGRP
jgi:hypothetical protein